MPYEGDMSEIKKGHKFFDPINPEQGYELQKDLAPGTTIMAAYFKPFGGAEVPVSRAPVPDWLLNQLFGFTIYEIHRNPSWLPK